MKYLPLRELILLREASEHVLRTRRAPGSFVPLRTLDAGGNANETNSPHFASLHSANHHPPAATLLFFGGLFLFF